MAKNSGIDWTDHTWNPWQGCRKVSPGCANCYMYRDKARYGQDPTTVVRSKPGTFNAPLHWKDPARVFVCSWSDFFIEDADDWRDEAWEIMRRTPHLTYMLLTKRAENIKDRLPPDWPLKNVWLGVTAENQQTANERLAVLLFDVPATKRFVSVEPMVGPVDLGHALCKAWSDGGATMGRYLDWVICGGESGPEAREMLPEWALLLKRQCASSNTPFFMKQMSRKAPIPDFLQGREFPESI
jgi:protein gp37